MSDRDEARRRARAREEGEEIPIHRDESLAPRPGAEAESAPEGGAEGAATESFKDAFEKLEHDVRVAEDKYLRALADLDNTRKHLAREKSNWLRYGHEEVVRDLLPILDNLERAVQAAAGVADARSAEDAMRGLLEGVELTVKQFHDTLAKHGVRPIESRGQPFDPRQHEAVHRVERGDLPAGSVVEEFQKGYQLHDRLLRPAKVTVASEPGGEEEK